MQRLGIPQDVSLCWTWLTQITTIRLQYFGHLARPHPGKIITRVSAPETASRMERTSRSPHAFLSWLRTGTVENDLRPLNLGLNCAWHRASDKAHWRDVVSSLSEPMNEIKWLQY